jgi:hypothetical protein
MVHASAPCSGILTTIKPAPRSSSMRCSADTPLTYSSAVRESLAACEIATRSTAATSSSVIAGRGSGKRAGCSIGENILRTVGGVESVLRPPGTLGCYWPARPS